MVFSLREKTPNVWAFLLCLAGLEPANKRMQAHLLFGYNFTLFWSAVLNGLRYLRVGGTRLS